MTSRVLPAIVLLLSLALGSLPSASAAQPAPTIDAKIEIVWPLNGAAVTDASQANIGAYIFQTGTLNPVAMNFDAPVRLWAAVNNNPAAAVATGSKVATTVNGITFPEWVFNGVDVSAARNPANKIYFHLTVDGVPSRTNVWSHGADARTFLPTPDVPASTGPVPAAVDAKIQIVWPHDSSGASQTVTGASFVNIEVAIFARGTTQSAPAEWNPTVRLFRSLNNGLQETIGSAVKRTVTSNGVTRPVWDFNNIPVSAAQDPINKYYFQVQMDEVPTYPTTWSHGSDARTYFPQKDVPGGPPAPAPAPAPSPGTGLRYGMQAHLYDQDQPRIMSLVRGAGFGWLKQQIRWEHVEASRGSIDWGATDAFVNSAQAQGVNLLFSVVSSPRWARADGRTDGPPDNYQDLGNFLNALAGRYRGRVKAYEVWNEENLAREWGGGPVNAGAYVELLKVAYTKIKQADPDAVVIAGALTPTGVMDPNVGIDDVVYLDQLYQYQGGVIKQYADAIGAHMAGYNNAPEDWVDFHTVNTPGYKSHPSFFFRRIDQLHDVMARHGDNRQMWITEYEWGSAPPPVPLGYEWTTHLSEQQVADCFVRSIQMMQRYRPWVGAIFIWNLNFRVMDADTSRSETSIFGILNPDWSPRLPYIALRDMAK